MKRGSCCDPREPLLTGEETDGALSTTATRAVPRTSSTWGGKVAVSMVKATVGLACTRRACTVACGGVQTTNCGPVQWNAIGIAFISGWPFTSPRFRH